MSKNFNKKYGSNASKAHKNNKNSRSSRRSNPNNFKGNEDSNMRDNGSNQMKGVNDIAWYSKNPNLLSAAANFAYPNRPGMDLDMGSYTLSATNTAKLTYNIPGVMVLDWIPSIGETRTSSDAASVTAKEIYARVRASFSGGLDADPADFVIYAVCLDGIFSYIAYMKRIYRIMNAWTPENRHTPDTLLAAMGISKSQISWLRENRVLFWQQINELVLQSRKFVCPAIMDLFNRHYWMSEHVYTDAPSIASQFYMFNPLGFYGYSALAMPDGNPGPGAHLYENPIRARGEVTGMYNFGLGLIRNLNEWDDSYTISGYLQRAFQGTPNFIVAELAAHEQFTPVYEPEVLLQIHNSRCIPAGSTAFDDNSTLDNFDITQNASTNTLLHTPTYVCAVEKDFFSEAKSDIYKVNPVLDMPTDTPSAADNVIATRLQARVELLETLESGLKLKFKIKAATEIPVQWRYVGQQTTELASSRWAPTFMVAAAFSNGSVSLLSKALTNLSDMSNTRSFAYAPLQYLLTLSGTTTEPTVWDFKIIGDMHNITTISESDLLNLHRVCIMSELNAFGIAE